MLFRRRAALQALLPTDSRAVTLTLILASFLFPPLCRSGLSREGATPVAPDRSAKIIELPRTVLVRNEAPREWRPPGLAILNFGLSKPQAQHPASGFESAQRE